MNRITIRTSAGSDWTISIPTETPTIRGITRAARLGRRILHDSDVDHAEAATLGAVLAGLDPEADGVLGGVAIHMRTERSRPLGAS